ncbi:head-tail connector protein [Stappia sp. ES.058]|uniref:head-tail connector protein n=1 Tax=Stappia sp. ES.058 TaxID=1881061 RepID=UPI00087BB621|nr:head-tail connector protein [Stappia sp. ES.058]SDT98968.1 phage conserved hypothetical protein, phiE125 gp8 family [Stappia sp. ES.058]
MTAIVSTPPAQEPVTLEEARAHLRVSGTEEDPLISGLIAAARQHLERATRRALITQGWRLYLDAWPPGRIIRLPVAPVFSVDGITVYDGEGLPVVLTAADFRLDGHAEPPRLRVAAAAPAAMSGFNGIEVEFTAGYGADGDAVPPALRQAILVLVAHWFDNRAAGFDLATAAVPVGWSALLEPYRMLRL